MSAHRYSGKFVLRLPPAFHERLSAAAQRAGVSLNRFCHDAIESTLRGAGRGVEGELTEAIAGWLGDRLVGVALFGSAARGEQRPDSDFDLLIAVRGPISRALYREWDERESIQAAARAWGLPVNPQFVSYDPASCEEPGGLWLECAIDGRVLQDSSGALGRRLIELRRQIAEGRYRRAYSHGHPYWLKNKETA